MSREPDLFFALGGHDTTAVDLLNRAFHAAARNAASDIHLYFDPDGVTIKFQIASRLKEYEKVPMTIGKLLDEKIRARASMSMAERSMPLDGRFSLRYPEKELDCRVNIFPTISGQTICCRIMDSSSSIRDIHEIQMTPMARACLNAMLREPNGLILICGPTGSGKSTTLYAALQNLNDGTRNILTLEDPVEKIIKGISQGNVDQYLTFPIGLRAILRQKPNVVMVGEIRDEETANIAIKAAISGVIVLATVHANSAPMAITRLVGMGVDPQALADALRGVISQRMIGIIDPALTQEWREPTQTERLWLSDNKIYTDGIQVRANVPDDAVFGIQPVMEMLKVDQAVRSAIVAGGGEITIANAAVRQVQFETMAQACTRLATTGETTLEWAMFLNADDAQPPSTRRLGQVLVSKGVLSESNAFDIAVKQIELKEKGLLRRFGDLLLEDGLCSREDIIDAICQTEGAMDLLSFFVDTRAMSREQYFEAENCWRAEGTSRSILSICLEKGILTEEQINAEALTSYRGHRLAFQPYGGNS